LRHVLQSTFLSDSYSDSLASGGDLFCAEGVWR
jgi:hypothetical protein